jgi:hypothetical protein
MVPTPPPPLPHPAILLAIWRVAIVCSKNTREIIRLKALEIRSSVQLRAFGCKAAECCQTAEYTEGAMKKGRVQVSVVQRVPWDCAMLRYWHHSGWLCRLSWDICLNVIKAGIAFGRWLQPIPRDTILYEKLIVAQLMKPFLPYYALCSQYIFILPVHTYTHTYIHTLTIDTALKILTQVQGGRFVWGCECVSFR